jgi:hypothetical protein
MIKNKFENDEHMEVLSYHVTMATVSIFFITVLNIKYAKKDAIEMKSSDTYFASFQFSLRLRKTTIMSH